MGGVPDNPSTASIELASENPYNDNNPRVVFIRQLPSCSGHLAWRKEKIRNPFLATLASLSCSFQTKVTGHVVLSG
jgi:hypothetical protein